MLPRTIREIVERCGIIVGSPVAVADLIEQWVQDADLDGFNLSYASIPGCYEDIVDLLVPELQRRGRYKTEYEKGTLREKLFGFGPRLEKADVVRRLKS